jgi:hypothetical protein
MKHPNENYTHLTLGQLNAYRAGSYSTEMIQMIDRHLRLCMTCRDRVLGRESLDEEIKTFLHGLLVKAIDTPIRHFDYERVVGYVDDQLNEAERELADGHLADCSLCRLQVSELSKFKTELQEISPSVPPAAGLLTRPQEIRLPGAWLSWNAWRGKGHTLAPMWSVAATAVLFALAASLLVLVTSIRRHKLHEQQAASSRETTTASQLIKGAQPTPSQTPLDSTPPIQSNQKLGPNGTPSQGNNRIAQERTIILPKGNGTRASKHGASPSAVTLNDGPGQLNFEGDRPLEALEKLDQVTRRQVLTAFKSQRLNRPESLKELEPSTEFRGPDADRALPEESTQFKHLSPVNTVLREDQPMFRWMPHPAAVGYKVRLFDDQDRKIAESPLLPLVDSWRPVAKLPRGRQGVIYSWKLVAILKDGQELVARRRTGPPKFFIVGEDNLERLQTLEESYPGYHLLLGIAYADSGLTALAEQELAKFQKANPNSAFAARLLRSLRSWSEVQ